jgi:hypothetical protein
MKLATLTFAASLLLTSACADTGGGGRISNASSANAQISATPGDPADLSEETKSGLQALREEEKLARDVYLILADKWGLSTHENIAASEQTHMDRVATALDIYLLDDPVPYDNIGSYASIEVKDLYSELVDFGETSEVAALTVGATIEDLDIRDIGILRATTTDAYIHEVLDLLECGSQNHMRAFFGQLASKGVNYKAQYITDDALSSIVATSSEKCGA